MSDVRCLSQPKSILDIYAEVPDSALDFRVPEKDLDGTQISGRPVDDRCLRSTQRVRAVVFTPQADTCDPLIDQTRILPSTDVVRMIDAAGKGVVVYGATTPLKPGKQTRTRIGLQFELNRSTRPLL